jgi:hypothetical protein
MIPHRSLYGENSGNGIRYRVAACRKRLRNNRTTRRSSTCIQMDEQFGEIDPPSILRADGYSLAPGGIPAGRETRGSLEHEEAEST